MPPKILPSSAATSTPTGVTSESRAPESTRALSVNASATLNQTAEQWPTGGAIKVGGNNNKPHSPTSKVGEKPKLPTPINLSRLRVYLSGYEDDETIIKGFSEGFGIPSSKSPSIPPFPRNHESARSNCEIVCRKIEREISLVRIAGPFPSPPLENFVCSPLGLVPKSSPGSFRLIHDLSYPKHDSVNSNIDPDHSSVSYETLDHCVSMVNKFGKDSLIAKADLEDAFRLLPISQSSYGLLGFEWEGQFYFDKCLPMGCSISCCLFEAFSSSLQWVLLQKLEVPAMSHILDDFIFFWPPIF